MSDTSQAQASDGHIRAPWTSDVVEALNRCQRSGRFHGFTCGGSHPDGKPLLEATPSGWVCPERCGYEQNWAHAFMAGPLGPWAEAVGAARELGWRAARTYPFGTTAEVRAAVDEAITAAAPVLRDAAQQQADTEVAQLVDALAALVIKATEYGRQGGELATTYLLPVGPIHRAAELLQSLGVVVRPGFDGRAPTNANAGIDERDGDRE